MFCKTKMVHTEVLVMVTHNIMVQLFVVDTNSYYSSLLTSIVLRCNKGHFTICSLISITNLGKNVTMLLKIYIILMKTILSLHMH